MTYLVNLRALFEEAPRPFKFEDIHQELQAVRDGDKAMSVISWSRSELRSDEMQEIIAEALDYGLSVSTHLEPIVHGKGTYQQLYVFFVKSGQDWRVPALIATRQILGDYRWTDGAEHLEGYLLGYSEADIAEWATHQRHTRAGWGALTIYLLMSEAETERVRYLGMRCLEPGSVGADLIAFSSRGDLAVRSGAEGIIPKGTALLRAAVKRSFFARLFGPPSGWGDAEIISAPITKDIAELMNPALESNLQIFRDGGWQ
jgi:hypothetical protein